MALQLIPLSGNVDPVNDKESTKKYLYNVEVPRLFESLLSGLIHHQPQNPVTFLRNCLDAVHQSGGIDSLRWDSFIETDQLEGPVTLPTSTVPPKSIVNVKPKAPAKAKTVSTATATKPDRLLPISCRITDSGRKGDISKSVVLVSAYLGPIANKENFENKGFPNNAITIEKSGIGEMESSDDEKMKESILSAVQSHRGNGPVVLVNYPRDATQLEWLLTRVGGLSGAIVVDYDEDDLKSRIALTTERSLNSAVSVANSLEYFKYATLPVLHWFDRQGILELFNGGDEAELQQNIRQFFTKQVVREAMGSTITKQVEVLPLVPYTDEIPEKSSEIPLFILYCGPAVNLGMVRSILSAKHVVDQSNAVQKLPNLLSRNELVVCINFPSNRLQFDWFMKQVGLNFNKAIVIDYDEEIIKQRLESSEMQEATINEAVERYKLNIIPIMHWFDRAEKLTAIDGKADEKKSLQHLESTINELLAQ